MATEKAEVVVIDGGEAPRRFCRSLGRQPITTLNQVREEMARVYRALVGGKITIKEHNAAMFGLQTIARTMSLEKVEALERIEELAERLERQRQQHLR
jgi:hypothetical protein